MATWVGLDGWSNADVVQDGVDYATTGTVGSYSAWYEYYPSAPVFNTSMVVHPDDTMQFWSWECDSTGVHGAGHTGYGCFWYQNETTNVSAGGFIVRAPNGLFQGLTAEGVIERQPGIPLSLFSQSDVEFDATDTSGATHNVNSDAYLNITLINNSGATMAHTNYYISPDVILFTWNRSL